MPALVGSERYGDIRAALDISLDASTLPDTIIELDIYLPEALRWIDLQTPKPPYTDDQRISERAKNAVVYMTAALLAPSIPNIIRERESTGEEYQREKVDWLARAAELRYRADEQVILILDQTPKGITEDRPQMFGLAHGYRGRY